MTTKDIHDLLKLINRLELSEFKMKDGDFQLSVRTKHFAEQSDNPPAIISAAPQPVISVPSMPVPAAPPVAAPASAPAAAPTSESAPADDESKYVEIKSPMVGTFYRSASPDKPPYAKVGDSIEVGDTICIIEAMKLFNEVDAEISGKIVKVMIEDAQPVEYDQVLFLVDPS